MKKLFLALGIVAALTVGTNWSRASQIYGELQKALFEKLSSDPTGTEARFYWNTADKKAKIYDGTSWVNIGTGSSSGINYLSANPDAEANVTGWTTYADAAGVAPVDCTGGSPASTWTRTTSTPLRGTGSFLWTKSAANRQGEGVAIPFTLDVADQSKPLTISFDVTPASGTYVTGDLTSYIYDVTNATVIQPAGYQIVSTTAGVPYKMVATFQASAASTSYRYCVHTASTSATAYTVKFDNFVVGPAPQTLGVPATDWVAYTPIITGFGTPSGISFAWKREASDLLIYGQFTSGTPTTTPASVSLPTGLTSATLPANYVPGLWFRGQSITQHGSNLIIVSPATAFNFAAAGVFGNATADTTSVQNADSIVTAGAVVQIGLVRIPIAGWSANVAMSSDAETRVVAARAYRSTTQNIATTSATKVAFDAVSGDTHAALDVVTNNRYNVAVPGSYKVSTVVRTNGVASENVTLSIRKNGSNVAFVNQTLTADNAYTASYLDVSAIAGDYYEVFIASTADTSYSIIGNTQSTWMDVYRLSGPATVAASESVVAKAYLASNQSIANTSTNTTVLYDTIVKDSHGAFSTSTGIFTCPVPGQYLVAPTIRYVGAQTWTAGNYLDMNVLLNSTSKYARSFDVITTGSTGQELSGATIIGCLAGETIKVQTSHNRTGGSINLFGSQTQNTLSITKVGNY